MTSLCVTVEMELSQKMTMRGTTSTVVVDQTVVLSLRTGQQHVQEVRNVCQDPLPCRVVTFGYHGSINVSVEQNNLQRMIGWMTNSVVPPPPPASAPGHQMEMDTVKEQSRLDEMLVVKLVSVITQISLPVAQERNVLIRLRCVVENNCVKMGLMWNIVTSTTMMFVYLIIDTRNVLVLYHRHQNTNNVMLHPQI